MDFLLAGLVAPELVPAPDGPVAWIERRSRFASSRRIYAAMIRR
jgi:hypothetical protein